MIELIVFLDTIFEFMTKRTRHFIFTI